MANLADPLTTVLAELNTQLTGIKNSIEFLKVEKGIDQKLEAIMEQSRLDKRMTALETRVAALQEEVQEISMVQSVMFHPPKLRKSSKSAKILP